MSRLGITYEEVAEVATSILQTGQNPTIEKIRNQLGTGSVSTISKYLLHWRNRAIENEKVKKTSTPPEAVNEAVSRVWEQLQSENKTLLDKLVQESEEKIGLAQREKEEALKALVSQKEENQNLRLSLTEVRDRNRTIEIEQFQLNEKYTTLVVKNQALEEEYSHFKSYADKTLDQLQDNLQRSCSQHEQTVKELKESYLNLLSDFKVMAENQRHDHIVERDALKIANQKLQSKLEEKEMKYLEIINNIKPIQETLKIQNEQLSVMIKGNMSNEAMLLTFDKIIKQQKSSKKSYRLPEPIVKAILK